MPTHVGEGHLLYGYIKELYLTRCGKSLDLFNLTTEINCYISNVPSLVMVLRSVSLMKLFSHTGSNVMNELDVIIEWQG